jgi:hypothetical protein
MNKNTARFTLSITFTTFTAWAYHPTRGPQDYFGTHFTIEQWYVSIPITFTLMYFLIIPSFQKRKIKSWICSSCEVVKDFPYSDKSKKKCSKCGSTMIELEGFYENKK